MFPDRTTLAIFKLCVVGAVVIVFYLWARGNGAEAERSRTSTDLAVCQADRATLTTSMDEANAKAAVAKLAEAQQQAKAEEAIAGAKQDAKTYEARIADVAGELERAKRQPTCRTQLEAELCAPLD